MIERFEDLKVFQRAYKASLEIHRMSLSLPEAERYVLSDQMRRASRSICALLAEGFGKQANSKREFRRYLLMAVGSSDEMRVWLRYCYDLGYIGAEEWQALRDEYEEISKMLQGLVKSLG